jgi:hypothetical protein
MTIKFLDIEYVLREDKNNKDGLILSVQSRQHNCSTHVNYSNEAIKEKGTEGILKILKAMEDCMIYQKTHELIK